MQESLDAERPPKPWWDRCYAHVKQTMPNYTDEQVRGTCGYLWHSGRRPSFKGDQLGDTSTEIIKLHGKDWQVIKTNDEVIAYERLDKPVSGAEPQIFITHDIVMQDQYKITKTPEILAVDVIVSREGVYPYPERNRNEAKLGLDLRQAAKYIQSAPGFDRHPKNGERGLNIFLGTVQNISFDNKIRGIRGKDVFWRELLEGYDSLNDAIRYHKPFPISIGQYNISGPAGSLYGVKYGASQQNILIDHVAHLVDGSQPRCALGSCGMNVDSFSNASQNLLIQIAKDEKKENCPLKTQNLDRILQKLV